MKYATYEKRMSLFFSIYFHKPYVIQSKRRRNSNFDLGPLRFSS